MVLWTIYVQGTDGDVKEIEIDNCQTFRELRKQVSLLVGINFNDLLLVGKYEYNYDFNSKILKEIDGLSDECSLYVVFSVMGGIYK